MRLISTVAAIAIASLSPLAGAQAAERDFPNITNPKGVIESVTAETLAELATQIGGRDVKIHEQNGKKSVTFFDGDIPHNLWLAFCDIEPGKCFGVGMLVILDNTELKFTLDTLNQGNRDTSFLTFFREDSGKLGVGRVDLVTGGVTRENLGTEIGFFAIEFRETLERLSKQLVAGTPAPFQRASLGYKKPIRGFIVSPVEAARMGARMEQDYRNRFRRR